MKSDVFIPYCAENTRSRLLRVIIDGCPVFFGPADSVRCGDVDVTIHLGDYDYWFYRGTRAAVTIEWLC